RFSYSELSRALKINLSSIHSVLLVLFESGMLSRDDEDRSYSLGPTLVALGDAALRENPAIDELRVRMRELSSSLGREIVAYSRSGSEALCISRTGREQARERTVHVGQRIPLAAPFFSLFFAWAPDDEIEKWLARSHLPTEERERQREILGIVRQRGYSILLQDDATLRVGAILAKLADQPDSEELSKKLRSAIEEVGLGRSYQLSEQSWTSQPVISINVPVFDLEGQVAFVIIVNLFEVSLSQQEVEALAERVLDATRTISPEASPSASRSS
ncbi:MAG: hypothetical protein KJO44_02880, partial [Gemmatimonadetes bacterium]|nr:hypothetical protein [Gemmatimonadota bacterium]